MPASVVRAKHRDRDFGLRRALLIADGLGLWLALALAMTIAGDRPLPVEESLWILPILPLWALLFRTYQLYEQPVRRFEPTHLDDLGRLFHAMLVGLLGLWLFYKIVPAQQLDFAEVLIFGLVALPLIALLRAALRTANLQVAGPERVFGVAPVEDLCLLKRKLDDHPEYEMSLVGGVGHDTVEALDLELYAELGELESVIASGDIDHLLVRLDADFISQDRVLELMRACHLEGLRFGCFTGAKGLLPPGVEVNHIEGIGILTTDPPVLSRTANMMKRGLDLIVSATALVVLSPVLVLVAFAVKLDSRGPVLFRQRRVGKRGRPFQMAKFRTMVVDAEQQTAELMAHSADPNWLLIEKDPRVTRVGGFLRSTSLDELPELWNVLMGEMSLVGPRPLSERDDQGVQGWYRHRLDLVPGVTGYWQVLGRTNIPFEEMLEMDYAYVSSWSLGHDLRLLAKTIPAVLRRRGVN